MTTPVRVGASAVAGCGAVAVRIGGAVFLAGGISGVVSQALKRRRIAQKKARKEFCEVCKGDGKSPCQVCLGDLVVDYTPRQKPKDMAKCLCPMCHGDGMQKCANCMGLGVCA